MKKFNIGEQIDILIDSDVLSLKCTSIHNEKYETSNGIIEKNYYSFTNNDIHVSISWESK